jgi:Histidine kinase-, DNA gyrase B-, and HSP90-like ATPase
MTATIQAQVSSMTLSKVSRLFNASLADCLNELLQNARRAGASAIQINLSSNRQLTIADDGSGIANPQTLLTLGESDWSEETKQQEAPAGMGVFSLANRSVTIRSHDWQVHLTPAHFSGEAITSVTPCEMISGTHFSFTVTATELSTLRYQIAQSAKFHPLPVWFNDEAVPQQDFLQDAVYVENWQGLRLGLCHEHRWKGARINFYGLTLNPVLSNLCCNGDLLSVRVDVLDCPQLKLVLPTRKEVVQDAFWITLQTAIRRMLYRYVATLPHHDLSYTQWLQAQALGIELPVAQAMLQEFIPTTANTYYEADWGKSLPVKARSLLMDIRDLACSEQQVFWRAFQQAQLEYEPVAPNRDYVGYPWYDGLPHLSQVRFELEQEGKVMDLDSWREGRSIGSHEVVDQVWAVAQITDASQTVQEMRIACEVLLVDELGECEVQVEDAIVVVSRSAQLEVDELAALLEAAYFSYDEDCDSDSSYTQQSDFQEMACQRSARILLNDQAALEARIELVVERHLLDILPIAQRVEIRLVPRVAGEPVMSIETRGAD